MRQGMLNLSLFYTWISDPKIWITIRTSWRHRTSLQLRIVKKGP